MLHRSPSYRPSECCNADCFHGSESEPCWGEVVVVGEEYSQDDHWWIHVCQGHLECYDGDWKYRPEVQVDVALA